MPKSKITKKAQLVAVKRAKRKWLAMRRKPGIVPQIADGIGISPQAVHQWTVVPLDRVLDVERVTGVPRRLLRPDYHLPLARSPSTVKDNNRRRLSA